MANRALKLKAKKQKVNDAFAYSMKAGSDNQFHQKKYWLVSHLSNRRSDVPVTMEQALKYMKGVDQHYTLYPVN